MDNIHRSLVKNLGVKLAYHAGFSFIALKNKVCTCAGNTIGVSIIMFFLGVNCLAISFFPHDDSTFYYRYVLNLLFLSAT